MGVMAGAPSRRSPALQAAAAALLLLLCGAAPAAHALCNKKDKAVLLALKESLGNPEGLKSWNNSTDCCSTWGSMECDNGGRVTVVDIQSTNATGSIPASIGNLPYLRRLVFRRCASLTGPIPHSISKLRRLHDLRLEMNNLTGSIPDSIGRLRKLTYLSLSRNSLTGAIPDCIGGLSSLADMYLDYNKLTGPIPDSLDNLDQLQGFNVSHNQLCGEIPQWGVINEFPASAFVSNKCLCGHPLDPCPSVTRPAEPSYNPVEVSR